MKARSRSSSIPRKRFNRGSAQKSTRWTKAAVLRELKALADPKVRAKMEYFGVRVPKAHGISAPVLHQFAKQIGKDHRLARQLWATGIHEARILATLIGESEKVTAAEMDRWVRDFDAWDVVDAACCYLYAHAKPGCPVPRALSRAECQHRMTLRLMAVFHARLELDTRWLASRAGISRCPALSELISYLTFPRAALSAALG